MRDLRLGECGFRLAFRPAVRSPAGIDGPRAHENEPPDTGPSSRLNEVLGAADIRPVVGLSPARVSGSRQMDDRVDSAHGPLEALRIVKSPGDAFVPFGNRMAVDETPHSPAAHGKPVGNSCPQKSGCAGDEDEARVAQRGGPIRQRTMLRMNSAIAAMRTNEERSVFSRKMTGISRIVRPSRRA